MLQLELDSGQTSVSEMFEHVKIILELSSYPDARAFALSLTIKDILCEVADLTTFETFAELIFQTSHGPNPRLHPDATEQPLVAVAAF